ncbi:hypothetical protein ACFOQM_06235 [Paenibacillus sp. GCM10012307]|uniref:Uncharacterized protein n=1 Tax=Paenibacillus roseus TaxID=2798579 RepID=A0A934MUA8_9BACL|nr:hypothetical protein [Paenibacillus roseus]MBJ6360897.1 hypothetical protein [Paenibacillus roseus]
MNKSKIYKVVFTHEYGSKSFVTVVGVRNKIAAITHGFEKLNGSVGWLFETGKSTAGIGRCLKLTRQHNNTGPSGLP